MGTQNYPLKLYNTGAQDLNVVHKRILKEIVAVGSCNFMTERHNFTWRFETSIPGNEVWKNSAIHLGKESMQIFTYDSKSNETVGNGIISKLIGITESIRLSNYCSVFYAGFCQYRLRRALYQLSDIILYFQVRIAYLGYFPDYWSILQQCETKRYIRQTSTCITVFHSIGTERDGSGTQR